MALDALEESARKGYDDAAHLEADPDLTSLRGEARFVALLEQLKQRP